MLCSQQSKFRSLDLCSQLLTENLPHYRGPHHYLIIQPWLGDLVKENKMAGHGQDVKSSAVVKYAAVEMPATFHQLRQNTDLKQPPANWLQANSKWESYIRNVSCGHNQFSSIKMGHCYPELTGEIDVISAAENIKKLLKIPYSKCHVSMMVHRVGNTLLIDEFDIHRHLLRQQEQDWTWLRKFYYDTVARSMAGDLKEQLHVTKKNKTRDHLQNRNMFSKFLYYSIGKSDETEETQQSIPDNKTSQLLPDPFTQAENVRPEYQRTQEWTFEDIRMLVGTDLPIFGGGTHPCISLKLWDMREPINVLTGLDYWLDNLMCNVPELAMCYHLDGIVQSYELIKTEDIPKLSSSSEFSPSVIKDVAQNILSFLKSNATKEGHTYWLFKGHGDDIVKLYDLSSLCSDVQEDLCNNPFTVPVGMLLYRVARNLRTKYGRQKSGTIRTLLKNCLQLLDKDTQPQIVTSAQFLLSDLYVSDNLLSSEVSPDCSDPDSDIEDEPLQESCDAEAGTATQSIDVEALSLASSQQKYNVARQRQHYAPVSGDREQRCTEALQHITQGLSCLDESINKGRDVGGITTETEEYQARCNPNEAIPMHYTPLNATQNPEMDSDDPQSCDACLANQSESRQSCDSCAANQRQRRGSCDTCSANRGSSVDHGFSRNNFTPCRHKISSSQVSLFKNRSLPTGSWHTKSKSLLMRKGAVAFLGLGEKQLSARKFGLCWRYLTTALHCFSCLKLLSPSLASKTDDLLASILSATGDLHLMMARDPAAVAEQTLEFREQTEQEEEILTSAKLELSKSDFDWLSPFSCDVGENLERGCRCYTLALEALQIDGQKDSLIESIDKRLGNCQNELGVHYMNNLSKKMATDSGKQHPTGQETDELARKSTCCFEAGISQFKRLGDSLNVALLYANLGRLQRLLAQNARHRIEESAGSLEFSPKEAQILTKAQDCYREALGNLATRDRNPEVWDSILWELSSTCFTMATLLQDHAPLSTKAQEQVEEKVVLLMQTALEHCKVPSDSSRHATCQYRAATIHHRLASLYHNAYRNQVDSKKLRQLREQTEEHYSRALEMFREVDAACELLRVQLERVALLEYQLQNQTSPVSKVRTLLSALEILAACRHAVVSVQHQVECEQQAVARGQGTGIHEEGGKLIGILMARLQVVSHSLVKNMALLKGKKSLPAKMDMCKQIYSSVIRSGVDSDAELSSRCQLVSETLETISNYLHMDQSTEETSECHH